MIAAGELQLFVPFGGDHCRNHPNAFNLQLRQLQPASELWALEGAAGLVGSLQEVTLHERLQESWQLRHGCVVGGAEEEAEFEEELYTAGNTVVWSRGSRAEASSVYKAFTVDTPVQQTVCILQSSCINVHSVTGKDFISPLPFQVSHLWATAFGGSEGVQYVCDSSLKLVFSSSQPSILLCFDTMQGAHSIWALRTVTQQERSATVRCPLDQTSLPPGFFTSPPRPATSSSKASKVFLTSDFCENKFLCFLVENQLRCVKFIQSNDQSRLIFTSVTNLPACDAAPLQSINAMLVLEANGSLVLYTGTTRAAMPSPLSELRGSKHHQTSWLEDYSFPQSPAVQALRDPVSNRVTLVLVKWYNTYNAPGGPSSHAEWNQFVTCFLSLLGYNTERLAWTRNLFFEVPLSPVIAAKKARPSDGGSDEVSVCVDSSAPLFSFLPSLFYVLHLVYQELQLDDLQRATTLTLLPLLQQLARDLQLEQYTDLYWRDYPEFISNFNDSCLIDQALIGQMVRPSYLKAEPPSVLGWFSSCLWGEEVQPFPFLPGICERTRLLILSYALYIVGDVDATSSNLPKYLTKLSAGIPGPSVVDQPGGSSLAEKLILWLSSSGFTLKDLESVPFGVALPIREAIYRCQPDEEEDGMSDINGEVSGLIWSQDQRVEELCQRTMALPVGRGLFSLFSYQPVPTQPLPVPKLNLTGRAPPRSTMVDLSSGNIDVPANMTSWSSFHNGVAAGLKIAPASQVDSAWIAYNKPKSPELANEYAGFLMALGLNGHLTKLATLNIHDYLTKGHEMTSIGLLLGVSSAKLGTMDMSITRLLSIHIPALLPPTSTELDVPHNVQEGDSINVDVTCPGATLALAMIYLKTNNRSIADWLKAPDTMFLLDFIKPEFLLLRSLARCIIMWDEILPDADWVRSNVPQIIQENIGSAGVAEDVTMETLAQAHDYIIAGACLAVGFRFAGSSNSEAFECLYSFCRSFMKTLTSSTAAVTCLSMVLLALSMVMCGSGDLRVLQVCRFLHKRTGGEMNYGFHMAHHMALGILFLGRGRLSLSTSNSAIAALLCALYPHYPAHSTDNRYHLQALRHLVVLAAQPRLLVPVDVDTLKPCYALLDLTYKESQWYKETTVEIMAPTLLPELHLLKQVKVKGPRYWELSIDLSKDTQHLRSILSRDGVLYVKLRAGRLPYKEDPQGWKSLLSSKVNQHSSKLQAFKPEDISIFTSDAALVSFSELFCKDSTGSKQVRLVLELVQRRALQVEPKHYSILLSSEFLSVIHSMADITMETWHNNHRCVLESYLKKGQVELLRLAPVLLATPPDSVSQPLAVS
ncbi:hypothetical protein CRUP_026806 [Coryphaenoides rupestris]|nr:hypothetical protein CRUP_026806 [Coryphaenoides rupestris]